MTGEQAAMIPPVNSVYLYARFNNLVYFNGRGILLIRNPFKALISYFRHLIVGFHSGSNVLNATTRRRREHIGVFYTEEFEVFAYNHVEKWRQIVEDWVTVGNVHVVHFEHVLEDKIGEVEWVGWADTNYLVPISMWVGWSGWLADTNYLYPARWGWIKT